MIDEINTVDTLTDKVPGMYIFMIILCRQYPLLPTVVPNRQPKTNLVNEIFKLKKEKRVTRNFSSTERPSINNLVISTGPTAM